MTPHEIVPGGDPPGLNEKNDAKPAGLQLVEGLAGRKSRLKRYRQQKGFLKHLRRAASDLGFLEKVKELRDAVLRISRRPKEENGTSLGRIVALSGPRGNEGTSLVSLLLALSLGASKHNRVCFLDGRFNRQRFQALSDVLALCRNSCTLQKGASTLLGYYNESQPNVYFLKNPGGEEGLEFFSDKELSSFLDHLRHEFDFTIIDMPPIGRESGNIFILPEVDFVYLVVSAGETRLIEVEEAAEVLSEVGVKITGVVVNNQRAPFWSRLFWRKYFF
jgi:Mrp family chromosome partitioning ATPase